MIGLLVALTTGDAFADLPAGYERLNYIQGDGRSTRILTDFKPNPQTDKIVAEVEFPSTNKTYAVWCARGAKTTAATWTVLLINTGRLRADYNSTLGTELQPPAEENVRYTITYDRNVFSWSGGTSGQEHAAATSFTAAGNPIMLFASYYNGTSKNLGNYSNHKLYAFKIYRNGTLIHDYVPCRDADGNATLYDDVPSDQSTLTRTGTFAEGPVAEYIRVAGSPFEVSQPTPGYGIHLDMVRGRDYVFTCPGFYTNDAQTVGAQCLGWELKLADGTVTTGPDLTKTVTYGDATALATLTWRWDVDYKVAAAADAGGTVAPAEQWADEGGQATVLATVADSASHVFFRWDGVTDRNLRTQNPLTVAVDGPLALTARFGRLIHVATAQSGGSDVDGEGDGSAEHPYATIGKALGTVADGECAEIRVGTGDYSIGATLTIDKPVRLVSETGRPEDVRLNASAKVIIVTVAHEDAVLQGVTLDCKKLGCGSDGAGAKVTAGTVRNCIIRNHKHSTYTTCTAVYCNGATARLVGCVISNNVCGATSTSASYANHGIGLQLNGGAIAENCIIAGNEATVGIGMAGGVYVVNGTLVNCAVYGNKSVNTGGIRIATDKSGKPTGGVVNCTVFDNLSTLSGAEYDNVTPGTHGSFTNCAFKLTKVNGEPYEIAGVDCLTVEDLSDYFVDYANGDYRPVKGGLLVDAGAAGYSLSATDFAGNERVMGDGIDIGPYEFDPSVFSVTLRASVTKGFAPQSVTFTAEVSGVPEGDELEFEWRIGDCAPFVTAGGTVTTNLTDAGSYPVSVTLRDKTAGKTATDVRAGLTMLYPAVMKVVRGNQGAAFPYDTDGNAAASIEEALGVAIEDCVIELAPGDYPVSETIEIITPLTLRGATGDPADVRLNANAAVVLLKLNNSEAVVSDLTLDCNKKGCTSDGAGGYVTAGTVRNCIVRNHNGQGLGGYSAAYANGASAAFVGCVISNNTTASSNQSATYGSRVAGLQLAGGARAENCIVTGNKTTSGSSMIGGVYVVNGTLVNSLVYQNTSVGTGGVRVDAGEAANCVIVDNESSAGATYHNVTPETHERFLNCAFNLYDVDGVPYEIAGTACRFERQTSSFFVDYAHGDFRPVKGGALVDAGVGGYGRETTDFEGTARTLGETVDIGPYEFDPNGFGVTLRPSVSTGFAPLTGVTITAEESGVGEMDVLEFEWSVDGGEAFVTPTNAIAVDLTACGAHAVRVTLRNLTTGKSVTDERPDLVRAYPAVIKVVKGNVGAAFPYDTDEIAAASVEEALDAAIDGCAVEVAPETYPVPATIEIAKAVTIRGASGNPADVILKSTAASRMLYVRNSGAHLESVTIDRAGRNDNNGHGTGVYISSAGGTVSNCVFRGHRVGAYQAGAIAYATGEDSLVTHCVISSNIGGSYSESYGRNSVALELFGKARAENCLITLNDSSGENMTAAGAYVDGGRLVNCTVVANTAESVAGVYVKSGCAINCAIVTNVSSSAVEYNNICPGTDLSFTNCAFDCTEVAGVGCRFEPDARAYFTDLDARDYTPASGSKLINGGAKLDAYSPIDLGGAKRKVGRRVDIGCYEYPIAPGMAVIVR